MRRTIVVDLPGGELLAGLTFHDVYPALRKAEAAVTEAEARLAEAMADLKKRQSYAAELPAEVAAGRRPAGELEAAMRQLSAEAVTIPAHEKRVAEAQTELARAQEIAKTKLAQEGRRRAARLQEAADQLAPILEQLAEMDVLLGKAVDPDPWAGGMDTHWPTSPRDAVTMVNARLAQGTTALESAGFKSFAEAQHGEPNRVKP
jgi:hypothetical protein